VNLHPAGVTGSTLSGTNGEQQVGYVYISGQLNAGLWSGTAASFINLTPPSNVPASANAIDANQQVGQATVGGNYHAVIWTGTANSMVDIHPAGYIESGALAVSGGKQGGFYKQTVNEYAKAALWSGTPQSFVSLHPSGFRGSSIAAMSGNEQVGTVMTDGGQTRATLWKGTVASRVDLHPTGSTGYSEASDTNGEYQVGWHSEGSGSRAVIWNGTAASMVDLHAFVPTGYVNSSAYAVWTHNGTLYVGGLATNGSTFKQEACIWKMVDPNAFTFALNKTQVAGQNSVMGTIAASALPNARTYTTYDNSSLVNTPPTVTLPANATVKNFQITVTAVNSTINTTVYCRFGSVTYSRPLALIPLVPTALAFTPSSVTGGNAVSCRVVINGVAGPGGRTIAVFDNSPFTSMPSTVVVPPGATQVIFNINTTAVTSQKVVTLTARVSAGEKTGTFRINP